MDAQNLLAVIGQMRLMSHDTESGAPSPLQTRAQRTNGHKKGSNPGGEDGQDGQGAFVEAVQRVLEEDLVTRKYVYMAGVHCGFCVFVRVCVWGMEKVSVRKTIQRFFHFFFNPFCHRFLEFAFFFSCFETKQK